VIEVAHGAGVPVIVDSAYRVSPIATFRAYATCGADLVGFGAKYFGAPNSSGLLCGRRDLIDAARAHSFAGFERRDLPGYGRPLKIDRQEVVAVVTALREWLRDGGQDERDEAASRRGRALREALSQVARLQLDPDSGDRVTGLRLTLPGDAPLDGEALAARLQDGNPSIWTHAEGGSVWFGLHTVQDGDVEVIAERVREVLREG
jgi:seryl-tRNA(Sec) selenium transferase